MNNYIERSRMEPRVNAINEDFRRKGVAIGADRGTSRRADVAESLRVYYADARTGEIGVLGLAYALLAWSASARGVGARALARALAMKLKEVEVPPDDRRLLSEAHLRSWLQPSRYVGLPSAASAGAVKDAIVGVASEYGLENPSSLFKREWENPGTLLIALLGLSTEEGDTRASASSAARGFIDPALRSRLERGSREAFGGGSIPELYGRLIDEVGDLIAGDIGRHSIVVLHGDPLSGKRGIVVEMLHRLADLDNETMAIGRGMKTEALPLYASATFGRLRDQLSHIADFLDIRGPLDALGTPELLKLVEDHAADTAAVYIFGDFPLGDAYAMPGHVPEALARLLSALKQEGSQTRILLTSQHGPEFDPHSIFRGLHFTTRFLTPPMAGDLVQRLGLSADIVPERTALLDGPVVALLTVAASIQSKLVGREKPMADIKKALSSLRQPVGPDALAEKNSPRRLRTYSQSAFGYANRGWDTRLDLRSLARVIYNSFPIRWQKIVLHAAMVEGGLDGELFVQVLCREPQRDKYVPALLDALKTALLGIAIVDPHAYRPEGCMAQCESASKSVVVFEPVVRMIFEGMLLQDHPEEARNANAMVARFIQRQRQRLLLMTDIVESEATELFVHKSAEYLRRSLVSMTPNRNQEEDANDLHYQIRLLYNEVFSKEVDGNFRLSFQMGFDALRLNLLRSFLSVGFPVYIDNREEITNKGWAILCTALSSTEIIDFVNSLAVAARRTRAWWCVAKATTFAEELVSGHKATYAELSLAFRAKIDADLFKVGAPGFPNDLNQIRDLIDADLTRLAKAKEEADKKVKNDSDNQMGVSLIGAEVKLRSRLASTLMLLGEDKEAARQFSECQRLDAERLQIGNRHGATLRWVSPAYAGMGPRRHVHLLLRQALSVGDESSAALLSTARALHQSSLTRVSKHPREKMLFMIDGIALLAAEGHLATAYRQFMDFLDQSPNSNMTLQSRMEMDFICMQIAEFFNKNRKHFPDYENYKGDISKFLNKIIYRMCSLCQAEGLPLYATRLKNFAKTSSFSEFTIDLSTESKIADLDPPQIGLVETSWPVLPRTS